MIGALGAAVVLMLIFGVGFWVSSSVDELREENAEMRRALKAIERKQGTYLQQRREVAALEVRMGHAPLELNTFVEKAAAAVGVSISESGGLSPAEGDGFTRRAIEIKLAKLSVAQLASFLKTLEAEQAHIVQVTQLNVRTRWNRNQELDVEELVVATYDRKKKSTDEQPKRAR